MSARASFNLELLRHLRTEHPDWSNDRLAEALNDDNEVNGRPRTVTANTVSAAVTRNRAKWKAQGFSLPRLRRQSAWLRELMEYRGYLTIGTEENKGNVTLRRLRACERLSLGLSVNPDEAEKARRWEELRRAERTVVDLSMGRAILRAAEPWELDAHGNLRALYALPQPTTGEHSVASVEANPADPVEGAILANPDLTEEGKRQAIVGFRALVAEQQLDSENEDEEEQNGAYA